MVGLKFKSDSRSGGACRPERGRISGTVKLATGKRFFGTIVKHAGAGRFVEHTDTCSSGPGGPAWEFGADRALGRDRDVGVSATPAGRSIALSVDYEYTTPGNVFAADEVTLRGPRLLRFTRRGATIRASSSRLAGAATFRKSSGVLRGDLVARFDDLGTRHVFAFGPLNGGLSVCSCLSVPSSGPAGATSPAPPLPAAATAVLSPLGQTSARLG